jgi:hypothetical protein
VPFVNPVNVYVVNAEPVLTGVHGPKEPVLLYSTEYCVIAIPPLFVGAVHVKETCALPDVPVKFVGLFGVVKVDPITIELYGPNPIEFSAAT